MFQRQVAPGLQFDEIVPPVDFRQWRAELERVKQEGGADTAATLRRVGSFVLAAPTVPAAKRKQVIASRLPTDTWPDARLLMRQCGRSPASESCSTVRAVCLCLMRSRPVARCPE